jgi:hypothetical protein
MGLGVLIDPRAGDDPPSGTACPNPLTETARADVRTMTVGIANRAGCPAADFMVLLLIKKRW